MFFLPLMISGRKLSFMILEVSFSSFPSPSLLLFFFFVSYFDQCFSLFLLLFLIGNFSFEKTWKHTYKLKKREEAGEMRKKDDGECFKVSGFYSDHLYQVLLSSFPFFDFFFFFFFFFFCSFVFSDVVLWKYGNSRILDQT